MRISALRQYELTESVLYQFSHNNVFVGVYPTTVPTRISGST